MQTAEVGDADRFVAKLAIHLLQLLMRDLQEAVDQPQLIHHLQGRGVNGVAAEIPKKIGVLFQHQRLDAGAAQQITQHHAGRAAADNAAMGLNDSGHHLLPRDAKVALFSYSRHD